MVGSWIFVSCDCEGSDILCLWIGVLAVELNGRRLWV